MNNLEAETGSLRKSLNNSRGNTMIEMGALLLPFLLLLFSVIEFGWYFFHEHTLQYATREGMRLALVGGVVNNQEGNPLNREDSIVQTIQQNAAWAMDINSEDISIFVVGDNYQNPEGWETAAPNAGNPADYMRVVVEYDHAFLTPLIGPLLSESGTISMRAQGTYRNELFDTSTEA